MTLAYTINEVIQRAYTQHDILPNIDKTTLQYIRGVAWLGKDSIVPGTAWRLALDLGVELQYTETGIIGSSPWIDDYAQGADLSEVLQNLLVSLVEYRESLERQAQQAVLSDELVETLEKLRTILVR